MPVSIVGGECIVVNAVWFLILWSLQSWTLIIVKQMYNYNYDKCYEEHIEAVRMYIS